MSDQQLNLAGKLASTFITSKLTIIIAIGIAVLGITALIFTPREENPQIVVPGARVSIALPGASAQEVEELIVTPLEGVVSEVSGVDHTSGIASDSLGVVTVQFKAGQPKEESLVKLYDRVLASQSLFPEGASTALVQSVDSDDVPIVSVTLSSETIDDFGLKRVADRMADRLRSIDDVSIVQVYGGRPREVSIELDPVRLEAFGVSLSQVYASINASNLSTPLGEQTNRGKTVNIRVQGFYTNVDDVRHQVVGINNNRPVYLSDIAIITDGPRKEIETYSRFTFGLASKQFAKYGPIGMPAVTIAVSKKKNTNAVTVSDRVISRIRRMQQNFIPDSVEATITRNDGQKANDAVNTLIEHLFIAITTVGVIICLFLGWKESLIVSVSIPLILFAAMGADLFAGVTINRITLFALILSLGLMVDASIVVLENIHRHYGSPNKKDKIAVTVLATNEIGNPTNLATFAVMLVFASMITLTGMVGQYFYPITFNVPIVMAASVVIAYIITPWAANLWLNPKVHEDTEQSSSEGLLQRLYLKVATRLLEYSSARKLFWFCIAVLFILSALQGAWPFLTPNGLNSPLPSLTVGLGFLPKDDKNTFNIIADMPEGTTVEETDRLVRDIEVVLGTNPYVTNYQSWLGLAGVPDFNALQQGTSTRTGGYVGEIRVNLISKHDRNVTSIELVRKLRHSLTDIRNKYPEADIRLVEDPPGPPVRATVLAEVYGPNPKGIREMAGKVEKEFRTTYGMVDISNSEPHDIMEQRIVVDKDKAALSKVSIQQITQPLALLFGGGTVLSRIHAEEERQPVDIRAFVPRRLEVRPYQLDRVAVDGSDGQRITVSELVHIKSGLKNRPINHRDNERVSYVGGELEKSPQLYAVLDLNRRLQGMTAPDGDPVATRNLTFFRRDPDVIDGYSIQWTGEMRMMLDTYRDMTIALGVAMTLVYLLLVAYYRSFMIPLIAMSSVPLGLIGILPGHWIMGMDFSATSMIGIIALSGVVIRNSLLIIDFIRDNAAQGMPLKTAVLQAGVVRLRPILLTTLAILTGSAVIVLDAVFGGLAISLIFGTLTSTMLTIFVVPLLFYMDAKRREQ